MKNREQAGRLPCTRGDRALKLTGAAPAQHLKTLDNGGACPSPMAPVYSE